MPTKKQEIVIILIVVAMIFVLLFIFLNWFVREDIMYGELNELNAKCEEEHRGEYINGTCLIDGKEYHYKSKFFNRKFYWDVSKLN